MSVKRKYQMSRIISYGEYMLRLSPPGALRFTQTPALDMLWGGAEANTCAALAQLGADVGFVTAMPDNDIGQAGINELRRVGVDTSAIVRTGERVGIYYCENGASIRAGQVIYDRKNSAVAEADPSEYSWSSLLCGCGWLHLTGITLAISEKARESCRRAAQEAKRRGVYVSFDINYRSKLWDISEASKVIKGFMPAVDLLFCGYGDLAPIFGVSSDLAGDDPDNIPDGAYLDVSSKMYERFGTTRIVFSMRRTIQADETEYGLRLTDAASGGMYDSRRYHIDAVDRVGAGDAADAGVIFSSIRGDEPQRIVEFGAACGAIKHTVRGDLTAASLADVENVMRGGLRVRR